MLKKNSIRFALFIALIFALLTFQSTRGDRHFTDFVAYPLQLLSEGSSFVIKTTSNFFNSYIAIVGKEEENRRLLKRIGQLENDLNRYNEIELENRRLREVLKLSSRRSDYVATAEIFAKDPTNWFQVFWINKGTLQGVSKDMVAVTHLGPVGKVQRALPDSSNIILITDVNSSIAVRIQSSRTEGILEGRGDNTCLLKYVSKESSIKTGDRVVTSGLEGIYPEGLLVGYVTSVKKEGGEMFQSIIVSPSQDLQTVEEVMILKR